MNSAFLVACLVLNASVLSVGIRCYQCIENNWNDCQQKQTKMTCSDPSLLGNTHCYSVSGKYDNGTAIRKVVARGCIACSDKQEACNSLKLVLATVTNKPLTCDIECCREDLCNTVVPQTTRRAISHTTPVPVYYPNRAPRLSLQVAILILAGSPSFVLMLT